MLVGSVPSPELAFRAPVPGSRSVQPTGFGDRLRSMCLNVTGRSRDLLTLRCKMIPSTK
jgi:hypothetical protein